jgi:hypothetical protein
MHACMYVCMYVHVISVCMHVCTYACMHVLEVSACMHVCTYACMHVIQVSAHQGPLYTADEILEAIDAARPWVEVEEAAAAGEEVSG